MRFNTALGLFSLPLLLMVGVVASAAHADGPYQATGVRIGEVTPDSAIVWTRLTRNPERAPTGSGMPTVLYRDPADGVAKESPGGKPDWDPVVIYPEGTNIESIEGAAPGTEGEVRLRYRPSGGDWQETAWEAVDPMRDFTRHFTVEGLAPNTRYELLAEARGLDGTDGQRIEASFRTAPEAATPERVVFTVSTGQRYSHQDGVGVGFPLYDSMLTLDPSFFVHTGDILYYDELAKSVELARWHWARTYSFPTNVRFHRQVASYFIKDDHDTWQNDCWPAMPGRYMGEFTFAQGQEIFLEQVPMSARTYRSFRWGKDLQIWLVEGRDFRSPNTMPDGPDKTIWGAEQKAWFKRTVQESDATFRVLISPTPIVGPDRFSKADNHANAVFAHEGNEIREFIATQKNMIAVCGDRHWQYVSVDPKTGIREYSCGPASDQHAGGWQAGDQRPEHQYLNVIGGYLAITVDRENGQPILTARHHGIDGRILHEERRPAV